jgi:outer membrane protein
MNRTLAVLLIGAPLLAQSPLSLQEAVRTALEKHPSIEAGRSGVKAAESRVTGARSGRLPKLNYSESWTRSDNPVFVFSSLLTQHQFAAENFALGPLNRPNALNNFQSQVTLDQAIYDGGQTRLAVRSAALGRDSAREDERLNNMGVIAAVVRAYHGATLAAESLKVANEAVRSAEADLSRAQAIRTAGMSTDADVLSIRVHHAAMLEQQIRRRADLDVAIAALNEALGLPLSQPHDLATPLTAASLKETELGTYEKESAAERPEMRQARLGAELAETQGAAARSALRPQVQARVGLEADRQRFVDRGGANWLASVSLRWNLFNGFADKARIEEAGHSLDRARALETQAGAEIRLQVRRAYAGWTSANQRIQVAQAAVSMAEESLRITKDRYDNGLANVTDLLRTETALLEARSRRLAALYDQRVAAVDLELAAGTLNPQSEVLN